MQRNELVTYLDNLLETKRFNDYAPNGLQVAGCNETNKIITGVTACQALLDEAVKRQADLVLVHHGYFWKGEDPCVTGIKKNRLQSLLINNINLMAYHLPLDAHPTLGNNVQLAERLGIDVIGPIDEQSIVWQGRLLKPLCATDFAKQVAASLNREPLLVSGGEHTIETIAWCTGGAPDYIDLAAQAEVDAYLTGEVAERTTHSARELGIHFYAAGHHATERYGIEALGQHLQHEFGLEVEFVDIDNPV